MNLWSGVASRIIQVAAVTEDVDVDIDPYRLSIRHARLHGAAIAYGHDRDHDHVV
jgi:hypothetical protein